MFGLKKAFEKQTAREIRTWLILSTVWLVAWLVIEFSGPNRASWFVWLGRGVVLSLFIYGCYASLREMKRRRRRP